jgi:HK97 family phage major capsid protein
VTKRLPELRRELSEVRSDMTKIDQAANGGALEGEAQSNWDRLDKRANELDAAILRATKIADMERRAPANDQTPDFRSAVSGFDIARGIRGQLRRMGHPVAGYENEDDGAEREASTELARRGGIVEGFAIPLAAVTTRDQRALVWNAGAGSGSGLQAEEFRPQNFIEELRPRNVVGQLGATFFEGMTGSPVGLPKMTASNTLTFVAENAAITPADGTVGRVSLSPKIAGAITSLTPITLAQPFASRIVSDHLLRAAASGVDRVALVGGGAHEPSGIWNQLVETALGEPTWAEILGLIEGIENDNALGASLGWALNPSAVRKLRSTPKLIFGSPVTETVGDFIMESPTELAGYAARSTTHVPPGSGSPITTRGIICGDFSQLVVGFWESASILLNPYSTDEFQRGNVAMRVMLMMDVALRHTQAFRTATINN